MKGHSDLGVKDNTVFSRSRVTAISVLTIRGNWGSYFREYKPIHLLD